MDAESDSPEAEALGVSAPARGDALAADLVTEEQAEAQVENADEFSLAREFYDAYKAYRTFWRSETQEPEQSDLDDLCAKLKAIGFYVARLRLFSPNEELDDVSTGDLKFLLVPYLLAEVVGATRDMTRRLDALKQAIIFWRAFAHDCERLKIAHADDFRAIDRDPEARLDPATKREEKIGRYKRSKDLDEKVDYFFGKKREALGDEFRWGCGGSFDEDMERELVLAILGRAVASTADSIASALQELPMLEMMMARGGPGAAAPERPPPAEKPFVVRIQDKAELMRIYKEMVFQCPIPQPTISLAEAADYEMEQMRETQERKAEQERRQQFEADQRWYGGDRCGAQEDAEDEQKTYKDRDWDDWKDEHPYGSGNKMANLG